MQRLLLKTLILFILEQEVQQFFIFSISNPVSLGSMYNFTDYQFLTFLLVLALKWGISCYLATWVRER